MTIAKTSPMPKIRHQLPLTRFQLRPKPAIGPLPSMTTAWAAQNQLTPSQTAITVPASVNSPPMTIRTWPAVSAPVAAQLRESADYYHHDAYDECCAESDRNHYPLRYEQCSDLECVRVALHHVHFTANVVSRHPEDNRTHGDYREYDVGQDEDCSKHRERRLFGRE